MRRGAASVLLLAVVVTVFANACRRSLANPDALMGSAKADGQSSDVPAVGVPKADPDAGTCLPQPGEEMRLVCFGSDPAPYQQFLVPADGGVAPGQCPSTHDFMPYKGGETCGYVSCGPLLGSAVSDLLDGGTVGGDAGMDCCYLVALVCGV